MCRTAERGRRAFAGRSRTAAACDADRAGHRPGPRNPHGVLRPELRRGTESHGLPKHQYQTAPSGLGRDGHGTGPTYPADSMFGSEARLGAASVLAPDDVSLRRSCAWRARHSRTPRRRKSAQPCPGGDGPSTRPFRPCERAASARSRHFIFSRALPVHGLPGTACANVAPCPRRTGCGRPVVATAVTAFSPLWPTNRPLTVAG